MPWYWPASPSYHQASADHHKSDLTSTALKVGSISRATCVIDVGCGAGHSLRMAREVNDLAQLIGIDPDDSAFTPTRSTASGIAYVKGAGEKLPFMDGMASHVISRGAINWMHQERGLREMIRVLTPGGTLIIMFCGFGYTVKRLLQPAEVGLRQALGNLLELVAGLLLHFFGFQASRKSVWGRVYTYTSIWRLRRQLKNLDCEITWLEPENPFLGLPIVWWAVVKKAGVLTAVDE